MILQRHLEVNTTKSYLTIYPTRSMTMKSTLTRLQMRLKKTRRNFFNDFRKGFHSPAARSCTQLTANFETSASGFQSTNSLMKQPQFQADGTPILMFAPRSWRWKSKILTQASGLRTSRNYSNNKNLSPVIQLLRSERS